MACYVLVLLLWQVPSPDLEPAREAVGNQEYEHALQILDSFFESDTTNVEGRYLRGVALRERGRNPTLKSRLQQLLARSANDFEFVLAQDSAYRDVLLQYAILKRYQNDLEQAIILGEAQLRHRPELDYVLPRLLSLYWRYLVTTEPEEARLWLRLQTGTLSKVFVGRAYERQGLYDAAEDIYRENEAANQTISLLARARLDFARMRPEEGTRSVEDAITNLNGKVDALILFEEIKMIASPAELAAFERIDDSEGYRRFFNVFWNRRNPMPAAPYNARMAEHYRRLRVAEQDYLFNGFRSWFRSMFTYDESYFPPTYLLSSDFTDQGIVFIRHGEPDDYTIGEANSWLYNDSVLVFHFAPTCISQICGITEHFVPSPVGPTFEASLVGLDALDAERRSAAFLAAGLSTDRHRWPSSTRHWEVPYVVGAFRGIDGRTLLEVYYKVPLHQTARISGPDSINVETGFAVHGNDWDRINYIREQSTHVRGALGTVDRFQLDLPAAPYHFAFHARVLGGVHLQATRFRYTVPRFTDMGLQLSDILLADSIDTVPDAVGRDEVILYVNPFGRFSRSETPVVYFEIYNLEREPDGQTRYRIAYSLIPQDGDRTGAITLQTSEQRSFQMSPISYVSIELEEASRGSYTLEVVVEDLVTGAAAQAVRALTRQ